MPKTRQNLTASWMRLGTGHEGVDHASLNIFEEKQTISPDPDHLTPFISPPFNALENRLILNGT
jgi:hypothetical protein